MTYIRYIKYVIDNMKYNIYRRVYFSSDESPFRNCSWESYKFDRKLEEKINNEYKGE